MKCWLFFPVFALSVCRCQSVCASVLSLGLNWRGRMKWMPRAVWVGSFSAAFVKLLWTLVSFYLHFLFFCTLYCCIVCICMCCICKQIKLYILQHKSHAVARALHVKCYVVQAKLNRWNFRCFLKLLRDDSMCTESGRLFQTQQQQRHDHW